MKIAVGGKVLDGAVLPVAVILTDKDRENIRNMAKGATVYACFPDNTPVEDMERWVDFLKGARSG